MVGHLSRHLHGKNSVNASNGDIGMLLDSCALKSLNRIERTQPRIMCVTSNGNP